VSLNFAQYHSGPAGCKTKNSLFYDKNILLKMGAAHSASCLGSCASLPDQSLMLMSRNPTALLQSVCQLLSAQNKGFWLLI